MIRSVDVVAAAIAFFLSHTASAASYSLYAKYHQTSDEAKTVKVPIDDKHPLLRSPIGLTFDGVFLKPDASAKHELNSRNLAVAFSCASPSCKNIAQTLALRPTSIDPSKSDEEEIIPASAFNGEFAVETFAITVREKPTARALCQVELAQRIAQKKSVLSLLPAGPGAKAAKDKNKDKEKDKAKEPEVTRDDAMSLLKGDSADVSYAMLFEKGLSKNDAPILYSFCAEIENSIDYSKLVSWLHPDDKSNDPLEKRAEAERARQKKLLGEWLLPHLKEFSSTGEASFGADAQDRPENIYFETRYNFTAIRAADNVFDLVELDTTTPFEHSVVDQSSEVALVVADKTVCFGTPCQALIDGGFVAYVDYTEPAAGDSGTPAPQHLKVPLRNDGGRWIFDTDLKKLLNQTVSFRVAYKMGDAEYDVVAKRKVIVRNLGLVTSFPVVSEVVGAISNSSEKVTDIEVQSSIPLSYAVPLRGGGPSRLAVTFPWMLGVNTRHVSDLADWVRIFPHLSLVFPSPGTAQKTEFAFGAGVALAKAFALSFGYSVGDTPTPYFMIGVSVTDLVKVLPK